MYICCSRLDFDVAYKLLLNTFCVLENHSEYLKAVHDEQCSHTHTIISLGAEITGSRTNPESESKREHQREITLSFSTTEFDETELRYF